MAQQPVIEEFPIEEFPIEQPPDDEYGSIAEAWKMANTPMLPQIGEFAGNISDALAPGQKKQYFDPNSFMGNLEGYGHDIADTGSNIVRGGIRFAGDMASEMTSPVGLASLAATGGAGKLAKAGYKTAGRGMQLLGNLPMVGEGLNKLVNSEGWSDKLIGAGQATLGTKFGTGKLPRSNALSGRIDSIVKDIESTPNAIGKAAMPPAQTPGQIANAAADAMLPPEIVLEPTKVMDQLNKRGTVDHIVDFYESKGYTHEIQSDGSLKFVKKPSIVQSAEAAVNPAKNVVAEATKETEESIARKAYDLSRGLLSGMDLSAPLRQGLPLIHRKEFWTALKPMIQAGKSESAFKAIQDSMKLHPNYQFAKDAGIYLGELGKSATKREEAIMSTWAEKVPGIRASNRAYTAFLDKLRFDTFNSLTDDYAKAGIDLMTDLPKAKSLANFVNTATGRGELSAFGRSFEGAAKELNDVFYSPRLISSRIKMYNNTLNPVHYWNADPIMRKESLKAMLGTVMPGLSLGQIARLGGAEIESDPTSTDFGKIKIGNTRIDPFGGFQQYAVLMSKIAAGGSTPAGSDEFRSYDESGPMAYPLKELAKFGINKTHPMASMVIGMLDPKGYLTGRPSPPLPESILRRVVPIIIQDIYDVAQEDPKLLPFVIPAAMLGMGSQTFRPQ